MEKLEPVFPPDFYEEKGCLYGTGPDGGSVQYTLTPVRVLALVRSPASDTWSLQVEIEDSDGKPKTHILLSRDLLGGGGKVLRDLADAGLVIIPGRERGVTKYLRLSRPEARRILAPSSGWLGDDGDAFVTPHEVIGNVPGADVIYAPEVNSPSAHSIYASGTLEEWQREVALRAQGNPILVFCLLVAFLGPLLKLMKIESAGFHLYGRSSRGKTTALQGSSAVWGNGSDPATAPEKSFIRRWSLTANAVEGIAAAHSGMLTALDELATFTGTDFGAIVYNVTGGQGKSTFRSNRTLAKTRTWEANVLSSGEITIEAKIAESGKQAKAGQLLRIVSIPVGDNIIVEPHGESPADFAVSYKHACSRFFGTAGPAFVTELVKILREAREESLQEMLKALESYTADLTPKGTEPEQARAIRRFAALKVAGELAVDLGILPYSPEEVHQAIVSVRDLWLNETRGIGDTTRAVRALRHFLVRNHSAFVSVTDPKAKVKGCIGFWNSNRSHHDGCYLFTDEQLAAASGLEAKAVAKQLREYGFLLTEEAGRLKVGQNVVAMEGKKLRLYAVRASLLEANLNGEESTADSEEAPVTVEYDEEL